MHKKPFDIALQTTKYLEKLEDYRFKQAALDVAYEGKGKISKIIMNHDELQYSYQIPENKLKKGDNKITVEMSTQANPQNILAKSTVMLKDIKMAEGQVVYDVMAYGKNVVAFLNLSGDIQILNNSGERVQTSKQVLDDMSFFEFDGRGKFKIILE